MKNYFCIQIFLSVGFRNLCRLHGFQNCTYCFWIQINPLQQRLVRQAATTPGHALTTAYNRKMDQSGDACRKEGMVFIPLPMETLGGWHEQTVLQVKKLAYAQATIPQYL